MMDGSNAESVRVFDLKQTKLNVLMGNGNANSLSGTNQTTFEIIDFNDVINHIISCHVIDWMVFRNGPNRITRMNSNNFSRAIVEGRLSPESIEMSNYEPKKYEKHKASGKEYTELQHLMQRAVPDSRLQRNGRGRRRTAIDYAECSRRLFEGSRPINRNPVAC